MPEKLFDNFIRSKLSEYSSPVPDGLWEKIVRDKDQRPKIFWWSNNMGILTVISVIILLTAGFFIIHTQKQTTANTTTSTLQTKTLQAEQDNRSADNSITSKDNTAVTDTEIITTPSVTATSRKKDLSNISSGFIISKSSKGISSFPQNKNEKYKSNFIKLDNTENDLSTSSKDESQTLSSKSKINGELLFSSRNIYNRNNLHNPPLNLRSILGLGNDCPSANGNQRNDWYLEVYGSPDYTMKTLSGNGLNSTYLQKKDSAEKMYGGFTVGAKISKNVGDHFILKAGVQYSQLNEKFALQTESERRTTVVIVSRTIIRPQGDTTFNDTTTVTQIGYAVRKNINSYKNIEIPIGVGYEFGDVKDKWKLAVNGGVIVNVTSWYTGETIDTSFNVISVSSKGNSGFYTRSTGLSLYGSASIIHNINDKIDVFAEPYFRLGLSSISSNIGYSQKFNAAGISLGVRMKLNKKQHL